MKNNKIVTAFKALNVFILSLITVIYVHLYIDVGNFDNQIDALSNILDKTDPKVIIIGIVTVVTIISLLIEYFISKFLMVLFFEKHLRFLTVNDAVIPKIITYILNIIMLKTISTNYQQAFSITAILGALLTFILFQRKNKNFLSSLVFALPFILDTLYSAFKVFLR